MEPRFFLGLGAPRCGTTWLAHYFRSHPQVGFSPIKELHHFSAGRPSVPRPAWKFPSDADYREYLLGQARPGRRTVGEISPTYMLLDAPGFDRMRRVLPGVKLIFALREPVARYWSFAKHRFGHRLAGMDVTRLLRSDALRRRGLYERTLAALADAVPPEDVRVVFYEHLMDPARHERERALVTAFLGLDDWPSTLERRVHPSVDVPLDEPTEALIARMYEPTFRAMAARFGGDLPAAWTARMAAHGLLP